jgi:RNA polymerase sigma-70 factor (ECF subfamily)
MSVPNTPAECKEIFAALSDYLSMELPPDACADLEAHLQGCPPCIEFVESLRKSIELCRTHTPEPLPDPLREEARQQLRRACDEMLAARKATEAGS